MTRRLLVLLVLLAAALGVVPEADAALYWGQSFGVGAANFDGSMTVLGYPTSIANIPRPREVCGVAAGGGYLYWSDELGGAIGRMALADSPAGTVFPLEEHPAEELSFISGVTTPCGIAVDSAHLYWSGPWTGTIGRSNLDGSGVERTFLTGLEDACGLAVDSGHIYWAYIDKGLIGRADLDGTGVEPEFIHTGGGTACGVAVDGSHVYWSDETNMRIGRANLDGTGSEPSFIQLATKPCGVVVADGHIYWANRLNNGDMVGRANLDGGGVVVNLVNEPSYSASCGITADARTFAPPQPRPADPFSIAYVPAPRRYPATARTLEVRVHGIGDLVLTSPQIGWSVSPRPESPLSSGWRTLLLRVWPGWKSAAGRSIHHLLERRGKATATLQIEYREQGHLGATAEATVTFHHPRRKARKPQQRHHHA
jgi:virginiamycin B lyase